MIDITGWSALSPFGIDTGSFTTGVRDRTSVPAQADPDGPPDTPVRLVPGFDTREVLGKRGTRGINRVTGMAIASSARLVEGIEGPHGGVVLCTGSGSVQSTLEFTGESLRATRPLDVDPSRIAESTMNTTASRCAMWHQLTGPNTTLAGDQAVALAGLAYARRLLANRRADTVLYGAAEEHSPTRAWLDHHTRGGAVLAEGAAFVRLAPTGSSDALATVLAVDSQIGDDLRAVTLRALDKAGVARDDVWAVVPATADTPDLAEEFGTEVTSRLPRTGDLLGDSGAASGLFQLVAVLAAAAAGDIVVTARGHATVAAAVVRCDH